MNHRVAGMVLAGLPVLAGAPVSAAPATLPPPDLEPIQSGLDYHSFANIEQFRVTKLELDLRVDSDAKVLRGVVGLVVKRLDPAANELILDTRDLEVTDVAEKAQGVLGATSKSETTWVSRPYHFQRKDPILGQALVIDLPPSKKSSELIRIEYETSPDAPGLQWMPASQTAGRHEPFLLTQSEPIGARSWIPLQDTPLARITFIATIHTSPDVLAVMTARNDPKAKRNGEYAFINLDAIPPNRIALAVGDLKFQETGPRTGVYAEKSLLKAAAKEFGDAESMVQAAEKVAGPYRWDRFDVVVVPAGFARAGAANPRVPFVSSTVIAGDKSEVVVIANEVAHSWAGDLVGNATWRDAWINEAVAEYLADRIMTQVYGEPRETLERAVRIRALQAALPQIEARDQVLAVDLRDRDPQLIGNRVACDKGWLFMRFLDEKFGSERIDAFLKAYFDELSFKSITTEQFLQRIQTQLLDRYPGIVTRDQVLLWVNGVGIPPGAALAPTNVFDGVDGQRARWVMSGAAAKTVDSRGWASPQWVDFLEDMPPLTRVQLADLDRTFSLARSENPRIVQQWMKLVIRNQYQPGYIGLEEYLTRVGRGSFIIPLYRELMRTPAGATQAKRVFKLVRPNYQASIAVAVDAIVNPASDSQAADE